ncbi:MAG: HNH endonuclease [Candidatus Neomarinimicrobiota bacterium]|nr:MAG: HNH endonuclease [Candidatus Neomarinimicrobiota bacterium]
MYKNNSVSKLNSNLTLVLNASYVPLAVCSSKRALCLYFLDKIDVLKNYKDYVHSPSMRVKIPSVVKLRRYVKHNNLDVVLNRKNPLIRDNFCCQYCFSKSHLTVDHIIPKEKSGPDTWENLIVACSPCNSKKGNRTPQEGKNETYETTKKTKSIYLF